MSEKMYVASSEDYGRDEQSAMVGSMLFLSFPKMLLCSLGY